MIRGAFLIITHEGKILLLNRRDGIGNYPPGTLELPGGGINDQENPINGLLREVEEEVGTAIRRQIYPEQLNLVAMLVSSRSGRKIDNQVLYYHIDIPQLINPTLSGEHSGYTWINYIDLSSTNSSPIGRNEILLSARDAIEICFGDYQLSRNITLDNGGDGDTVIIPRRFLNSDFPERFVIFGYRDNLLRVFPHEPFESFFSYYKGVLKAIKQYKLPDGIFSNSIK